MPGVVFIASFRVVGGPLHKTVRQTTIFHTLNFCVQLPPTTCFRRSTRWFPRGSPRRLQELPKPAPVQVLAFLLLGYSDTRIACVTVSYGRQRSPR